MTTLETVENLIATLTRSEKAQLLQNIVRELRDSFPGVESTPGVNGGNPSIVRTRIPIWLLVHARQAGSTDAELLYNYPTLRAEDLSNA